MALAEARLETLTGLPRRKSSGFRFGSLTEKSDVCAVNGCFTYGATQPHAVSSIAGTVSGVTNPNFFYDGNGNLRCMTALAQCDTGAAKTVEWTSFNMVSTVKQGTTNVSLLYDESHARLQQTAPEGVTQYLNDPANGVMTERFAPSGGGLYWRSYIQADSHIVAERSVKGSTVTVRYFTLDHLGSTIALTDEAGHLAESDAYDAWGKARDAATGADDPTCSKPGQSFTTRGFSGHEEMADLCLVNMNARIYDPTIGRFMSPDDIIPDAFNGQSYNRYSYVDNNPLSYADPTGHAPCTSCTGASNMSAPVTATIYVDFDSEGKISVHGAGEQDDKIAHDIGLQLQQGGQSGSHIGLAFSGSKFVGAFTFHGGDGRSGPADFQKALAGYFDRKNTTGGQKFGTEEEADGSWDPAFDSKKPAAIEGFTHSQLYVADDFLRGQVTIACAPEMDCSAQIDTLKKFNHSYGSDGKKFGIALDIVQFTPSPDGRKIPDILISGREFSNSANGDMDIACKSGCLMRLFDEATATTPDHELGHYLGFGHSGLRNSVMGPAVPSRLPYPTPAEARELIDAYRHH